MKKRSNKKINKFCCGLFILVSITSFAQENTISIEPQEFKNTIQLKTEFKEKIEEYLENRTAYEYYNNLRVLSEINGEIFDPPPVRPVGNFLNISNPNETVIGFFGVFSKSEKGVFVSRDILEERKFHGSCGDCRYFRFNGQLEIPDVYR